MDMEVDFCEDNTDDGLMVGDWPVLADIASAPTYGDLEARFIEFGNAEFNDQELKNHISSLNRFLEHHGLSKTSPIGSEFGLGFPHALGSFLSSLEQVGRAKKTSANHKSILNYWYSVWDGYRGELIRQRFTFQDVLSHYLTKAGHTTAKSRYTLSTQCGFSKQSIDTWLFEDRLPRFAHANRIARLEELVGIPGGALTCFLIDFAKLRLGRGDAERVQSTFGKRISSLMSESYRLTALPPRVLKEWGEFLHFKTTDMPVLERQESWRTAPKSQYSLSPSKFPFVTPDDGRTFSASAVTYYDRMRQYFGILVGKYGFKEEDLSMAHLMDAGLVGKVVDALSKRLGGVTETCIWHISFAMQLSRKETGYLRQQPTFAKYLGVDEANWDSWCQKQWDTLLKHNRNLTKQKRIKKGRDPMVPISAILARQHPLEALFDLREKMQIFFDAHKSLLKAQDVAALARDILLVGLMTVRPLRIKHYRIMEYDTSNKGNLYQSEDGSWRMRFAASTFKNEKGASCTDYDVPIPKYLWNDIETFLRDFRPLFNNPSKNVFVAFRFTATQRNRPTDRSTQVLNTAILHRTRQFITDSEGFGPHAFRHIAATEWIKNNPTGFQIAATLLHDRLDTVMKAYAHLVPADGHQFFDKYVDTMMRDWKEAA